MPPSEVLPDEAIAPNTQMASPQQRDDREDPATPTPNPDPLYSESELPGAGSFLENQEITSLIENWIDA
jgi:hypothetical protein